MLRKRRAFTPGDAIRLPRVSRQLLILVAVAIVTAVVFRTPTVAQSASEIVLRPGGAATVVGGWIVVSDSSAAGGSAVRHPNANVPKLTAPPAAPSSYFELTFNAAANVPYRLWLRGKADNNSWTNDSVYVQFSTSVDTSGVAKYRIGTTSAFTVNLEECNGCGVSGWGWQDNGWGAGVLGPEVIFGASGTQRVRIHSREDGLTIDQVVLSPQRYLFSSPGALKNDTTILPLDGQTTVRVMRRPYLQQMTSNRVVVVWATREQGTPQVHLSGPSVRTVSGTSRLVPASRSGLGFDYYHHEVPIGALSASTSYTYNATLGTAPVGSGGFRTAPATGSGNFSFIAFGDAGTGSTQQRQLATRMASDTFDVALLAGDIVYGNSGGTGNASAATYNSWFFDIYASWLPMRALYTAEGNHDSNSVNGNGTAYLDAFVLPTNGASPAYPEHAERYYSFDYGPAHFVVLDTEFTFQDATRRAEQLSWLESDLAATTQPWKIALYHRSPYSAGGEHGSDLTVRSAFAPLFERYGVQLSLSAHEHDYERTIPQRASATGTAVTYIVTGGGGAPLYPAGTAAFTAYSASRHHYVRGSVTACTISLAAIGLDGSIFDTNTLDRCAAPADPQDVILYATEATVRAGAWIRETDSSAAGGSRLRHPDAGAAKLTAPLASPANYFELTFDAEAGRPYRLWMRGKADANHWANDSVFAQFDGAVTSSGAAQFRIGTTGGTPVSLEECSGCSMSGWGWQDNGWGAGVFGPLIYFQRTGTQRIRVQTREDGFAIDQIVLSPGRFLDRSPGALRNDTTILVRP